jgi:hypothetical protein
VKSVRSNVYLTALLLLTAIFLSGCQTTVNVHNAAKKDIIPIFKDYVGMHGYSFRYQNDTSGTYNIDMGQVYVVGTISGSKSKSVIMQPANTTSGAPMTAYEQTTWNSVNDPAHYENAAAAISITQNASDVEIYIDTNSAGGTSLDDIKDYFKSYGYKVD